MKQVAIDTNLLVLLIVGTADRAFIARRKRLRAYTVADYDLLLKTIAGARPVVTPTGLAEISNLIRQGIAEPMRSRIVAIFRQIIDSSPERYKESKGLSHDAAFPRLGLTDSSFLEVASTGYTLLTDDAELYHEAARRKVSVVNFSHVRAANGLL